MKSHHYFVLLSKVPALDYLFQVVLALDCLSLLPWSEGGPCPALDLPQQPPLSGDLAHAALVHIYTYSEHKHRGIWRSVLSTMSGLLS
ncbi:hypothetical protein BDV41DRAFT_143371 [Aspergillus transmontanensis]|uniref:Uncharacterized protein n=1 Tax=Aspergillus transmontanensis TaxID=1034304 RepID=A0A5N6W541_9EURO|nr:hypothetical protein BDV41DRAFT_143371 [Aspergillus transmontanensis]